MDRRPFLLRSQPFLWAHCAISLSSCLPPVSRLVLVHGERRPPACLTLRQLHSARWPHGGSTCLQITERMASRQIFSGFLSVFKMTQGVGGVVPQDWSPGLDGRSPGGHPGRPPARYGLCLLWLCSESPGLFPLRNACTEQGLSSAGPAQPGCRC